MNKFKTKKRIYKLDKYGLFTQEELGQLVNPDIILIKLVELVLEQQLVIDDLEQNLDDKISTFLINYTDTNFL